MPFLRADGRFNVGVGLGGSSTKDQKVYFVSKHSGNSHIAVCLNRFLIHNCWSDKSMECNTSILAQGESNHEPIGINLSPIENLGPIPFRFNPAWLKEEGILELIAQPWKRSISSSPSYVWENKLKA